MCFCVKSNSPLIVRSDCDHCLPLSYRRDFSYCSFWDEKSSSIHLSVFLACLVLSPGFTEVSWSHHWPKVGDTLDELDHTETQRERDKRSFTLPFTPAVSLESPININCGTVTVRVSLRTHRETGKTCKLLERLRIQAPNRRTTAPPCPPYPPYPDVYIFGILI